MSEKQIEKTNEKMNELKVTSLRLSENTKEALGKIVKDNSEIKNQDDALQELFRAYKLNLAVNQYEGEASRIIEFKDHLYRAIAIYTDTLESNGNNIAMQQSNFEENTQVFVDKIKDLKDELEESQKEKKEKIAKVASLEKEVEQLGMLQELNFEYKEKIDTFKEREVEFKSATDENKKLEKRAEELEKQLLQSSNASEAQLKRIDDLEVSSAKLTEEKEIGTKALLEEKKAHETLKFEKQKTDFEVESLNERITFFKEEKEKSDTELTKLHVKFDDKVAESATAKANFASAERSLTEEKNNVKKLTEEKKSVLDDLNSKKEAVKDNLVKIEKLENDLAAEKEALKEQKSKVEKLESEKLKKK